MKNNNFRNIVVLGFVIALLLIGASLFETAVNIAENVVDGYSVYQQIDAELDY